MTTPPSPSPLLTTSETTGTALSPADRGSIVLLPLARDSVALNTATSLRTMRDQLNVPLLSADPQSAFVAEGDEISAADPTVSEVPIRPVKIAALSVISRELALDSEPGATNLLGESLARSVRKTLDVAYLTASGAPETLPPGGVLTTAATGEGITVTLDPLVDAIAAIEDADGTADVLLCSPTTWAIFQNMKVASSANQPLLDSVGAASQAAARQLLGIPVTVTPAAPDGVLGVWDRRAIAVVLREDVALAVDQSRYFELDSVGVRVTLRAAWAVLAPARVIKLAVGGS